MPPVQSETVHGMRMYRWGNRGKWYHTREEAEQQGRAIAASRYAKKKDKK